MSEVDTRPATRGRSSHRGGRGGFGRGGPRGSRKQVNGSANHTTAAADEVLDDQGELGDMKRQYAQEFPNLKEMFPDWADVDLLFALQECDGDVASTVDRITQGSVSQFSEVKKVKDRARSKVKEEPAAPADKTSGGARPSRGRGADRGRGGLAGARGRGGQRTTRGGHATTEGASKDQAGLSVPTTESSAWAKDASADAPAANWDTPVAKNNEPAVEPPSDSKESSGPIAAVKKTWASMFSTSKPAPAPAQSKATPSRPAQEESQPPVETSTPAQPQQSIPSISEPILTDDTQAAIIAAGIIDSQQTAVQEPELPPPKMPLTEENVEHLPDESHPPPTHTAASTVGSNDPRNLTPLPPSQQTPIGRPGLGGFATSAYRATSGSMRSASFQRRVQEQQEAVVMPGHNAVDRAAVQFGSMGLSGEPSLDVDDEREDPETRRDPQHSPPSQPKTSLPPAARPGAAAETGLPESMPTKQAPGLPPASQQNQPQQDSHSQSMQQDPALAYQQSQFGYGQSTLQQDSQQKPYDPFGHQTQHPQYDRFGSQHQGQQQPQQSHTGFGGLGSGPHDYSSQYYNSEAGRNAYGQYYPGSNYGAQDGRAQGQQQDASLGQQRSTSGYGNESAFGSQQAQPVGTISSGLSHDANDKQNQARYQEGANSGHNTPNPHGQQSSMNAQSMHQQPPTQQQQQQQTLYNAAGFPYGHPYFNSPYQQAYQNQFGYSQYGGGYPSKQGGMYNSPQGYNMGSQPSYDQHSSSVATSGSYNQGQQQSSMRSTSGISSGLGSGSGLDEYGRSSSQTQASSGFGGINDPFARGQSGFGQSGYNTQTSSAGQEDALKPFADQKTGSSPALGQPGRPASAANNQASTQSSLPPSQGGFGGYQGFQGQNNQYGGLGGLGGHQQGQGNQGGYSGYNANSFGQYGSYNSRGGWGQSYGAH